MSWLRLQLQRLRGWFPGARLRPQRVTVERWVRPSPHDAWSRDDDTLLRLAPLGGLSLDDGDSDRVGA